jgi:hypothetical protein
MVLFLVFVVGYLLRRERKTLAHPAAVRMTVWSLLILAALRVYSATSFLWAGVVSDPVLDLLRYVSLALTTVAGILLLTIAAYFFRKR